MLVILRGHLSVPLVEIAICGTTGADAVRVNVLRVTHCKLKNVTTMDFVLNGNDGHHDLLLDLSIGDEEVHMDDEVTAIRFKRISGPL